MTRPTRREFLRQAGVGAAALSIAPLGRAWPTGRRDGRDLIALARRLLAIPLEDGLRLAVRCSREGWTRDDLLGAIYVAGALEVRPVLGGISHCMMVVPSAAILADAAGSDEEAMLAVLFNLSDLKRSQARDRAGDDFVLPAAPATRLSPDEAGPALEKALAAWDCDASDRAAVAAARAEDLEEVFERLWPLGVRDFHNIGHKVIFTAHAYRTIRMAGRSVAEPVLRSLVGGLLFGKDADRVGFEENRERAAALGNEGGRESPEASLELLQELRTASPERAPAAVAEMLEKGVAAASLWDGVRLAASELHLRFPGLLAVHPFTSTNAMHFAAKTTRVPATRSLMLLQAAAWIAAFRDFLPHRLGAPRPWRIDGLEAADPRPADEVFSSDDPEAAFRGALALASSPDGSREFLRASRRQVLRKGDESHYYKYAAAVAEEHAFAHPRWSTRLLAASLAYLPAGDAPDTTVARAWLRGGYRD